MVKAIPDGYNSISTVIAFKDARKAIDFYKKAFGAIEKYVMPGPNGQGVMHAEVMIGNSSVMMFDENPQQPCKSAQTLGNSPVTFYLYVENVDQTFKQALAAGASEKMALQDMFWGDRMGTVQDPFGYTWSIATHKEDLSPQQIAERAKDACCK